MLKRKIAQVRPASTEVQVAQAVSEHRDRFTVDLINVCNVSEAEAAFRIFDASVNAAFDESTALSWDVALAAGAQMLIPGNYYFYQDGQRLGVRSSVANALTFTVYGTLD